MTNQGSNDQKEILRMLEKVMRENNELKQQMLERAEAIKKDIPDYQSEVITSIRSNPARQQTIVTTVNDMLSLGKQDPQMTLSEKTEFEFTRRQNLDQALDVCAQLLVRAKKRDITLKFPDADLGDE